MIDKHAIVEQVRMGTAPSTWEVLRARRSFFVQTAIVGLVLIIGAAAAAWYILTSNTVFGIGLTDQTPDNVLFIWLIIDLVVLLGLAVVGVVIAIRHFAQIGRAANQMLVLLPDGFVKRVGTKDKDTIMVNYEQVAAMRTSVERGGVYLLVQPRGGGKSDRVLLDGRFGKPKEIAQAITGTWAQVAARMRPAQG